MEFAKQSKLFFCESCTESYEITKTRKFFCRKKSGENCTSFVNKSTCEFCLYHVKSEYNKYTGKRFDLQATYSNGLTELRNKVLGKSEVTIVHPCLLSSLPQTLQLMLIFSGILRWKKLYRSKTTSQK